MSGWQPVQNGQKNPTLQVHLLIGEQCDQHYAGQLLNIIYHCPLTWIVYLCCMSCPDIDITNCSQLVAVHCSYSERFFLMKTTPLPVQRCNFKISLDAHVYSLLRVLKYGSPTVTRIIRLMIIVLKITCRTCENTPRFTNVSQWISYYQFQRLRCVTV